jgi:hypothetical protein
MTTDLTRHVVSVNRAEIQALIGGDVAVSRRSVAERDDVLIRPKTVLPLQLSAASTRTSS